MSPTPTFNSFPDLPGYPAEVGEPSSSKITAPVFASFPDLGLGVSENENRGDPSHRQGGHSYSKRERRSKERDGPILRTSQGYQGKIQEEDRDSHRKEKRKRTTYPNDDCDRSDYEQSREDRRRSKEERRARERETAEALARGLELAPVDDTTKRNEQWTDAPWYENTRTTLSTRSELNERLNTTSSGAFFVDAVGDRDVVRYGASSSYSAPRYYRDARGRVLGLSEGLKIVFSRDRTHKGIEVAPMGRPYIPRYASRPLDRSSSSHLARILLRPTPSKGDLLDSFTPFEVTRPRQERPDDLPAYRSITEDGAVDEEELSAAVLEALGQVSTLEEDIKKQTVEAEQYLKSHPDDVAQWIKYSSLHLTFRTAARQTVQNPDEESLSRANAEVTLSMLSRALDAHPANFTSPELHLAYFKAAMAFWPHAKITDRWQNVLRELGERGVNEEGMMSLWLGYIEWCEGKGLGHSGGVDGVIQVYIECFDKTKAGANNRDLEVKEENQVYLFLRSCLFLKQAGYSERALAIFQALMEITFFKPDHLRPPVPPFDRQLWFAGVLVEFEDFWDAESPRIGETGAIGWKETHQSLNPPKPILTHVPPNTRQVSSDAFEQWVEAEIQAEENSVYPGRASDLDVPEDDPYHVILFSDVKPFLFPVQSPSARLQLIYAFLNFLGLPFTPSDAPTSSPSASDPHLRWTAAYNHTLRMSYFPPRPDTQRLVWQTVGGEPMSPEVSRSLRSPFVCPVKSWVTERSSLFANAQWFRDLEATDIAHVNVATVRNTLTMLRPLVPDPSFVLEAFAFEAALSPKAAIRFAKSVLSVDRDNLALWDGYARLERQRGNITAARQVYITAIKAAFQRRANSDAPSVELQQDQSELWAAWAEMEWEGGEEGRCLEVLTMAAGLHVAQIDDCAGLNHRPGMPTPITMLKSHQYYSTTFSDSPSQLLLATLYFYLTEGVEQARDRLLNLIPSLPDGQSQAEEIYQLLVKLVHIHCSRNPSPASLTRDVIEAAITAFPNNTLFLSLFLWGEIGGRVYGRVQRLVSQLTSDNGGVVGLLWSVWAEGVGSFRTFWDTGGNGAERVRRALDRAINSSSGRYSAVLWILYIEFEALMGRFTAAKALCYRAINTIGGCKNLYIIPFKSLLRPHFTARELRSLTELMTERGIRVRVATEDFWDDQVTDDEGERSDDEQLTSGDYEYGMLREREELKPY